MKKILLGLFLTLGISGINFANTRTDNESSENLSVQSEKKNINGLFV